MLKWFIFRCNYIHKSINLKLKMILCHIKVLFLSFIHTTDVSSSSVKVLLIISPNLLNTSLIPPLGDTVEVSKNSNPLASAKALPYLISILRSSLSTSFLFPITNLIIFFRFPWSSSYFNQSSKHLKLLSSIIE